MRVKSGSNSTSKQTDYLVRRAPWGGACSLDSDDSLKAGCMVTESHASRVALKMEKIVNYTTEHGSPNKILRDIYAGNASNQTRDPKHVVSYEARKIQNWKGRGLPRPPGQYMPATEADGIRRFSDV
mmetsp:Transcript_47482/g.76515  ORF Transcript_47482/g.76515 Transcript_47482/m.76515 type:complete len:127 (-) Transcript_47482:107-487(-)